MNTICFPSGDQDGPYLKLGLCVICRILLPSASITRICASTPAKAIRLPSLDQLGCLPSVSNFCEDPSAAITPTDAFPFRMVAKTILVPSGDHSGRPLSPSQVS